MYTSQKFKDILQGIPETHFTDAQGHQRAGAITGSPNNFQSTMSTVYEKENQKTVNPKLPKQTKWFSDVTKKFYHYFPEKAAERQKE